MKKLLALVLAMVMTLGLATVGTSAAAPKYADSDSINYKEAVDVMSTIGVLGGDENGFRPGDELKRSEGAKIITYLMLGSTAAEQITGGTKYTDVPASHWAAGYIEYLTVEGVVGGIGDHKFDPDGTLTTAAFTKMLIGALGYDAEIEGLGGPDWAINVQRLAKQIGLFDGNKNAVASANIKREEAAQYAYNMIKSPLVEYENKGSTMSVNGATISFGAGKAKYRTNTGKDAFTRYQQISDKVTNDGNFAQIVEFAEEYYEKLVLKGNGDTDDFGRKADKWTFNGKEIGTYAKDQDQLYTSTVTLGTIYKDLGLTKATYPTDDTFSTGDSLYFIDGVEQDVTNVKLEKESARKIGGNGTETYVYYDEGVVRICEINWYVGDVTGVFDATSAKDAYIDIAGRGEGDNCVTGSKSNVDFKVDDIVRFTASFDADGKATIQTVEKAETTKGKLDSFVMRGSEGLNEKITTGSVTIGGKKYTYSNRVANTPEGNFIKAGVELDIVLDKYGYALDVSDYGVQNYAVVTNVASQAGDFKGDKLVQLLFTDGTSSGTVKLTDDHKVDSNVPPVIKDRTVLAPKPELANDAKLLYAEWKTGEDNDHIYYDSTKAVANRFVSDGSKQGITVGDIVTYSIDSSGKYTLVLKKHANEYYNSSADPEDILENGKSLLSSAFNYGGDYTTSQDKKGNGKTIYLIKDNSNNYKAYEGSKAIPTVRMKTAGSGPVFANSYAAKTDRNGDKSSSSAAQIVYLAMNNQADIYTNEAIFVRVSDKYNKSVSNGELYYAVEAVVNGKHYTEADPFKLDVASYEKAKDTAAADNVPIVLFASMTVDSKGIASLSEMKTSAKSGNENGMPRVGSAPVKNGMVGLGEYSNKDGQTGVVFEAFTKDVGVWYLNDQDEIVKSSVNNLPDSDSTGKTVYSWFTKDSNGNVNYILWTDKKGAAAGPKKSYDANSSSTPSFYELQDALKENDEVNIINTRVGGYTLPESLLGETLTIPAGHTLNIYYTSVDDGTKANLTVPKGMTVLIDGETKVGGKGGTINAANITVDGTLNIEKNATLNGDKLTITDNGHINTSGTLNVTNSAEINGSSLVILGGFVQFGGTVRVKGGLSITDGILKFLANVIFSNTSNAVFSGGAVQAKEVKIEEGTAVTVDGGSGFIITDILNMAKGSEIKLGGKDTKFYSNKINAEKEAKLTNDGNADVYYGTVTGGGAADLTKETTVNSGVVNLIAATVLESGLKRIDDIEAMINLKTKYTGTKVTINSVSGKFDRLNSSSTYSYAVKGDTVTVKLTVTPTTTGNSVIVLPADYEGTVKLQDDKKTYIAEYKYTFK